MLSVVSMLNYMGNETTIPSQVCTSLDEDYQENGLEVLQTFGTGLESSSMNEDWSVDMEFKPVYTEYDFQGDLVPTFPASSIAPSTIAHLGRPS